MLIRRLKRYDKTQLDLSRPYTGVDNHCGRCGGQLYFVKGSDTIVSCLNNDPAYLLLLLIDSSLDNERQKDKE